MTLDAHQNATSEHTLYAAAETNETRRARAWLADMNRRAKSIPFAVTGKLSPALAEILLAANQGNRGKSDVTAQVYANVITRGAWELNGETIIIANNGCLNDGQTRCEAVIRAGRSIDIFFVFGVTRESRHTLDQGRKRTLGNIFEMKEIPNANKVAPACRLARSYADGSIGRGERVDAGLIEAFYKEHPEIGESINPVRKAAENLGAKVGPLAAAHWIFATQCGVGDLRAAADGFFADVAEAIGSGRSDPVIRLRNMFIDAQKTRYNIPELHQMAAVIKAWNMRGKVIRSGPVEWQPGEPFPRAR